ncbi:hypothetical protein L596_022209 [Steinernema carpocapsae]|uniref:TUG ubiquitin-like domain-containing protein n=1 Tax=Steinernema carpocapsae TaxID=34508 RepID=A0A4U5ML56_STECR|nr:hypothetical protein L596_022209 [Steinernema carpocapsae]
MAKNFTVIAPNAHRCSLTAVANDRLDQVLETACLQLGFDFDCHDLSHNRKILNGADLVRLSGLANNATLEMVPAKRNKAIPQQVDVAIQLISGRWTRKLQNDTSILDMLKECGREHSEVITVDCDEGVPVCTYLQKPVKGELELANTTLKDLGIYSGTKALFRYTTMILTKQQRAGLADEFQRKEAARAELMKKYEATRAANRQKEEIIRKREEAYDEERRIQALRIAEEEERATKEAEEAAAAQVAVEQEEPSVAPEASVSNARIEYLQSLFSQVDQGQFIPDVSSIVPAPPEPVNNMFPLVNFKFPNSKPTPPKVSAPVVPLHPDAKKSRVESTALPHPPAPCERMARYYVPDPNVSAEVAEGFFDPTTDDLQARQAELSRQAKAEAPLAFGNFLEEENRRRRDAAYLHTVIKFKLPDQNFLQANFISVERTSALYTFIRETISVPEGVSLSLIYCSQKIPDSDANTLVMANLAPTATVIVSVIGARMKLNENLSTSSQFQVEEIAKEWLCSNTVYTPITQLYEDGNTANGNQPRAKKNVLAKLMGKRGK